MENLRAVWAGGGRRNKIGSRSHFLFSFTILPKQNINSGISWFFFFFSETQSIVRLLCFPKAQPSLEERLLVSIQRASLLSQGKGDRPFCLAPEASRPPAGPPQKGGAPQRRSWDNQSRWLSWGGWVPLHTRERSGIHAVCKLEEKERKQQRRQAERQGP